MKQSEIMVGQVYALKVSGRLAPVKITRQTVRPAYGTRAAVYGRGPRLMTKFYGVNLRTERTIGPFSAQRVRFRLAPRTDRPGWVRAA